MDLFEFIAKYPFEAFISAVVAYCFLDLICARLLRAYNRKLRSANIRAQGWPPAHCDADGDFKSEGTE